ncbi:hypothetical protein UP09_28085 [Bradyrhizobium sp. LTSP885]|uniref:hypothetical protein n=1 Tax=Bradyrhizobium sp. LTSP885 TaxID=1619232 RepID=UPI0005CA4D07|nr:hypothetical protein [Bradyrhizobium sp. LTSP885]KJC37116.1 hypothetical protein UP09_28085 [Bradyrhizobium sp. LTSP885]
MQKFIEELDSGDRRVANNWTIVAFSLYGSILASLAIYAAVEHNRDIGLAAADVSTPAQAQH